MQRLPIPEVTLKQLMGLLGASRRAVLDTGALGLHNSQQDTAGRVRSIAPTKTVHNATVGADMALGLLAEIGQPTQSMQLDMMCVME
jgi:hypothetical protein